MGWNKVLPAHLSLKMKQTLSASSYFAETIAAIYRSVLGWLERYFSFLAAIGTYCGEHLTRGTVAVVTVSVPLCFPYLTAFGTAFGLVSIAFGLVELLFLSAEGEFTSTIRTYDCFVLESHWMTSSLKYLVRVLVIQYMRETIAFNSVYDNQYLQPSRHYTTIGFN